MKIIDITHIDYFKNHSNKLSNLSHHFQIHTGVSPRSIAVSTGCSMIEAEQVIFTVLSHGLGKLYLTAYYFDENYEEVADVIRLADVVAVQNREYHGAETSLVVVDSIDFAVV